MAKSTKQNVENQSDSSEQEVKDILGKVRETLGDEKFAEIISSYGANSDDMNFSNVLMTEFMRSSKVGKYLQWVASLFVFRQSFSMGL